MNLLKIFLCSMAVILINFSFTVNVHAKEILLGVTGPLSGPAAEFGLDACLGYDIAVKEINSAGGITIKGEKYTFKFEKYDDRADPTQAVSNARRLKSRGAIYIGNSVMTTLGPLLKINEEKGNEFIISAGSSAPQLSKTGNKLLLINSAPFDVFIKAVSERAWEKGWRKFAMIVTLGAYGDQWRNYFKDYWQKKGGTITVDKPANYYRDTDFSTHLTAAMATKPDAMLIGGPSAPTALVIEQARAIGFKGGFIIIEQARMDYISYILRGTKLIGNAIGLTAASQTPLPAAVRFRNMFRATHKRMISYEVMGGYQAVLALRRAILTAGTATDVYAIRAAFPRSLPSLGDKFPMEVYDMLPNGRAFPLLSYQELLPNGKYDKMTLIYWWPKTKKEFDRYSKMSKYPAGSVKRVWIRSDFVD